MKFRSGTLDHKSVEMIKNSAFLEVIRELKRENVIFWIDQGSLLGLIRDKKFLSWDHDIDISTWDFESEKLKNIAASFQCQGWRVGVLPYVIKLKQKGGPAVDFRIYRRRKNYAITMLKSTTNSRRSSASYCISKRLGNFSIAVRSKFVFFSCKLLGRNQSEPPIRGRTIPHWLSYKINAYTRCIDGFLDRIRDRCVVFCVKDEWFNSFDEIEIFGEKLPVPSATEPYLEMKYGDGWRNQKKEWCYWNSDGAVYRVFYKRLI